VFFARDKTSSIIDYVTIASTGNGSDFGDMSVPCSSNTTASGTTRAMVAGGENSSNAMIKDIQYVTIGTLGNTADFGDLQNFFSGAKMGASNGHGGLA